MMPSEWAASSASANSIPSCTICSAGSGWPAILWASVMPVSSSMAMKGLPWYSSTSKMVQMLGWFKAEAERASRRKRLSLGMVDDVISQELQGNEAVKLGVLGLVDHTHAAA